MASSYKTFLADDIVSTRTRLNEYIPITGSIVSGTYGTNNIRNATNGMFQTVYDYPYLSASSNQLFDITVGISSDSVLSSSAATDNKKKLNIYSQMAHMFVGHDATGSIYKFDKDGDPAATSNAKDSELLFLSFSRLLVKDEIKKGSFEIKLAVSGTNHSKYVILSDVSGASDYRVNSPVGEYGILYLKDASASTTGSLSAITRSVGYVYYQAGLVGINPSVFGKYDATANAVSASSYGILNGIPVVSGTANIQQVMTGSITSTADVLRSSIMNVAFSNTTELNSAIHFCRLGNSEFNYSANPTYLTGSKIRVKQVASDAPTTYFTTVGLYSPNNELLAVAKLSEPIKKDNSTELLLKVRLDY